MKTLKERIELCRTCELREFNMQTGLLCSLTHQKPTFNIGCNDYIKDEKEFKIRETHIKLRKEEDEKTSTGGLSSIGIKNPGIAGILLIIASLIFNIITLFTINRFFIFSTIPFILGIVILIKWVAKKEE